MSILQGLQKNSVLILIVAVAFCVVLLGAVTFSYYISVDSADDLKIDEKVDVKIKVENNSIQASTSVDNNSPVVGLASNNVNGLMNNMENIPKPKPKVPNTGVLSNVADQSYKNYTGKQVFNVSNNIFTYDDARAVCQAHGAELATHQQVMDAYRSGAEWCNYGWSDKQMALYPTQKKTWEKLQEDPENANMCGEWGVNGGYFENPNTLFGANCYGVKPEPKNRERMGTPPISEREQNILARVARFKSEKDDLTIYPFNKNNWSRKN